MRTITDTGAFLFYERERLLAATLEHAVLVLAAVGVAVVVGVLLGILAYQRPALARGVLGVQSVLLTVPAFALFAVMIGPFGLGFTAPFVALVLYSLLPITRNTIAGLQGVEPEVVDAARGMGISRREILRRIELPLALPVIVSGVRVSTMLCVGIATIAAFIGGPGLGDFIFQGLSRIGGETAVQLVLSATLLTVALGLLLDGAFLLLTRLTTSRGLRG